MDSNPVAGSYRIVDAEGYSRPCGKNHCQGLQRTSYRLGDAGSCLSNSMDHRSRTHPFQLNR